MYRSCRRGRKDEENEGEKRKDSTTKNAKVTKNTTTKITKGKFEILSLPVLRVFVMNGNCGDRN
jgi:hypothetical protein